MWIDKDSNSLDLSFFVCRQTCDFDETNLKETVAEIRHSQSCTSLPTICSPFSYHPRPKTMNKIKTFKVARSYFIYFANCTLKPKPRNWEVWLIFKFCASQSLKPQLDRPNFMPVKYLNYNWIHLFIDINYLKICVANCLTLTMRSTNGFHLFLFCGWSWRNHFVLITSVGQPNFMDASQIFEIHQDQLNFWT